MGQNSQIYVRMDGPNGKILLARYYSWVYGERMVSRARAAIEWVRDYLDDGMGELLPGYTPKLVRILDTNFDMRDVQISIDLLEERLEQFPEWKFSDYVFFHRSNNDGRLFLDIDIQNKVVKYAFVDTDCNVEHIMDAVSYMDWDHLDSEWRKELSADVVATLALNAEYIKSRAVLMTTEELMEFINYDYEGE